MLYWPGGVVVVDVFLQPVAIHIVYVETPSLMGLFACLCVM